jgi:type II secretory pathway predicted ATPase ExeA
MFKEYYQMNSAPFSRDISTDKLYQTRCMQETVNRLTYAAERNWFGILTGDPGCGKTTMLRLFVRTLGGRAYRPLYISDSKLTPRTFYKGLLEQLGCEAKFYRGDAKRQMHHEITTLQITHQQKPIVIVDEAHLLDREMLEEVRFLLNTEMDSVSPMSLILTGQSELRERLTLQIHTAIKQRIDIVCTAPYFDRSETDAYIRHQLQNTGGATDTFSEGALEEIYRYTSGAARLINKVCTHSLMYGAQNGRRTIDDHIVRRIIEGEVA